MIQPKRFAFLTIKIFDLRPFRRLRRLTETGGDEPQTTAVQRASWQDTPSRRRALNMRNVLREKKSNPVRPESNPALSRGRPLRGTRALKWCLGLQVRSKKRIHVQHAEFDAGILRLPANEPIIHCSIWLDCGLISTTSADFLQKFGRPTSTSCRTLTAVWPKNCLHSNLYGAPN